MQKLLLILVLLLAWGGSSAQKSGAATSVGGVDSLVALKYASYDAKRQSMQKSFEKADSVKRLKIWKEYSNMESKCSAEIVGIYGRYLALDGVVSRIFALRTSVDKEVLTKIIKNIPLSIAQSDPYVRSLNTHINTQQVMQGDTVGEFVAKVAGGGDFRYSEFKNEKDLLLIFGGVECLDLQTFISLQLLYSRVELSKLEVVSVFLDTDIKKIGQEVIAKGVKWLAVSDLRGDHSPIKIAFGVQVLPTCVYISKGGCVEVISLGVTDEIVDMIKKKSYK